MNVTFKPLEEILLDGWERDIASSPEQRYKMLLHAIQEAQKQGIADHVIEAAYNITLKQQDRRQ